ncbi:hypothetical protein HOY82DRAFT_535301 [Tuber indicum]|nr:hypothetical protein HOY82DRAFT_535301 [Tuber indicum]
MTTLVAISSIALDSAGSTSTVLGHSGSLRSTSKYVAKHVYQCRTTFSGAQCRIFPKKKSDWSRTRKGNRATARSPRSPHFKQQLMTIGKDAPASESDFYEKAHVLYGTPQYGSNNRITGRSSTKSPQTP